MRSPELWEEEDVQDLITSGARENQFLEFKACDALEKKDSKRLELAKDVSAFANAAGGTIVYGLIESASTHEAERIDHGYDPSNISELWIEQVIDSKIQARIDGLVIKPVALKASGGKVLYVVCIPASDRAPHMANHKYYKRQNFQVVAMEEYEVRQRYHREAFPGKEIA
jgi:predicted HTH transcriptional regulator